MADCMAFAIWASRRAGCLLGGVNQANQIGRRAGQDQLERRAVRAKGLKNASERGQYGVLGGDFEDGLFSGDEFVPEPASGDFTVEANPMFMPAG